MPVFIHRSLRLLQTRLSGWRLPLAITLFVFATSWPLMWLAEPSSSEITQPGNYWWYFLVTASTVGYGDFFPTTAAGHVVGAYVIVGGIVTLTILFTQLATYVQAVKGRRMKGHVQQDLSGHVVLLGYTAGRTERIVAELCAEKDLEIVLCAWDDVSEHPMADHPDVAFVRGDLSDVDVLSRACVATAATVVIDVRDDNETLAIAVAAHHSGPGAHMVASLRQMSRCEHLRYVNPAVQCVQWHLPNLLVEEAQHPGITQIYTDLMTSGGQSNTYSVRLPDHLADSTFGKCQTLFGQRHSATVIAVRSSEGLRLSPSWDTRVAAGSTVYYLAARRVPDAELAAFGR